MQKDVPATAPVNRLRASFQSISTALVASYAVYPGLKLAGGKFSSTRFRGLYVPWITQDCLASVRSWVTVATKGLSTFSALVLRLPRLWTTPPSADSPSALRPSESPVVEDDDQGRSGPAQRDRNIAGHADSAVVVEDKLSRLLAAGEAVEHR
eukprot:scaffold3455_cov213-Prasinococcus_capsulatus_cf.AAC.13